MKNQMYQLTATGSLTELTEVIRVAADILKDVQLTPLLVTADAKAPRPRRKTGKSSQQLAQPSTQAVLEILQEYPHSDLHYTTVAKQLESKGFAKATASSALSVLVRAGKVQRRGENGEGDRGYYRLIMERGK